MLLSMRPTGGQSPVYQDRQGLDDPGRRAERDVPARLQARPGRHRVEAAGLALPRRPLARLAQGQEPRRAGGEA